jgi:asparagine synthase (glutamine-hydrolysing)
MCGICGVVDLEGGRFIAEAALAGMRDTLAHRGPDSAGLLCSGPAGLAMRRLAIIDVAGGQQPLTGEDGSVALVCNGEVYNYRDLRRELQALGHVFRTNSDSEVAVHAYEQWGDGFLERLNGMFALALWDERRRRLVLARDRMGIKPLYYARAGRHFLFASEPKAILAWPGFPRTLDLVSLNQYLSFEYVPTPRSIYGGIHKLRPGHRLVVALDHGEPVEQAYFDLDLTPDPALTGGSRSETDLAAELWSTFRDAVGMEMMSDVPLGVFLSGGIDSSAVAAAMTELNPGRVHSFSIGFEDPTFDESAHARRVARHLGTHHSEQILSPRMLFDLVPSVAGFLDEPLADPSIIPTHLLSRFAREQVTVALGGDGGDELFAGYSTVQAHRVAALYRRVPRLLRDRLVAPIVRRLPVSHDNMSFDFRAKRFILGVNHPAAERHHQWLAAYPAEEKRLLLTDAALAEAGALDVSAVLAEHTARSAGWDEISKVLYLDMKMYLEGDILVKVDRASMGCSLEVRVPMLNARMLAFANRLPVDLKLKGFTRKYLFRRALRGKIPDAIIDRPKKGFGFPVSKWFRAELKPLLLDLLSEERLRRQGLFRPAYVTGLIKDHMDLTRDNRKALWTLLIFQLWHDRYLGQASQKAA